MNRVAPLYGGASGLQPPPASAPPTSRSPPPLYADFGGGAPAVGGEGADDDEDGGPKSVPPCYYCASPTTSFATFCPIECALQVAEKGGYSSASSTSGSLEFESSGADSALKSRIFPSTRFFIAVLLCFCFISLSISTSNLSVSMVCMIRKADSVVATVHREFDDDDGDSGDDEADSGSRVRGYYDKPGSRDLQDRGDGQILRLKRSPSTPNATAGYISASSLFAQVLGALEELGLDNATLQYKALRDERVNGSAAVNDASAVSSNASVSVPVTLCQLARYRKHAAVGGGVVGANKSAGDIPLAQRQTRRRHGYVTVTVESCYEAGKLDWSSTDQGIVFAAQNAGSLLMLFTGAHADRLNSKWTIVGALLLLVISNALLPMVAPASVWLVVAMRALTGFSDALLQPSTSSMITRWFPPKERPFAVGLITGGRQIGTLMILPVAGFLCSRHDIANGWPAIFYLSALIGSVILLVWLFMSADKPSKHFCTSHVERFYIEKKISEENIGKRTQRRAVPWRQIVTCRPVYVGVAALICHEYPLVIMLQLLPKYINDVLKFSITTNGIVSALPIAVLFVSKTFFASLSSLIGSRKKGRFVVGRTTLVKIFNAIASLGLGVCVAIVPLLTSENQKVMAIIVLCMANAFAGLHTPGVQTALLQLAPAYTGIITGIAFGFVAIFSIINKVLSNYIVQSGSVHEWMTVFWIAAGVAVLPVVFFTLWGSADRQHWATNASTVGGAGGHSANTSCADLGAVSGPTQFVNHAYLPSSKTSTAKTIE